PRGGRGAADVAVAGHRSGVADRGAEPVGAGGARHGGRAGGQGGGGRRSCTRAGGAVRRADAFAAEPAAAVRDQRPADRRRAGRGAGTVPGRAGQAGRAAAVAPRRPARVRRPRCRQRVHPSVTAASSRVTALARVESTTASRARSGACWNRVANTNTFWAVGRPDITTAASSSAPSRPSSTPAAYARRGCRSTLAATTA